MTSKEIIKHLKDRVILENRYIVLKKLLTKTIRESSEIENILYTLDAVKYVKNGIPLNIQKSINREYSSAEVIGIGDEINRIAEIYNDATIKDKKLYHISIKDFPNKVDRAIFLYEPNLKNIINIGIEYVTKGKIPKSRSLRKYIK